MTQQANPLLGGGTAEGSDVELPSGDTNLAAYFARPAGGAAAPGAAAAAAAAAAGTAGGCQIPIEYMF